MSDSKPLIPALWFDVRGRGPSELALQLRPFAAEMDGRIPVSLDIQVHASTEPGCGALIYGTAGELICSAFQLQRVQVEQLHRELGAWLAATALGPVAA